MNEKLKGFNEKTLELSKNKFLYFDIDYSSDSINYNEEYEYI